MRRIGFILKLLFLGLVVGFLNNCASAPKNTGPEPWTNGISQIRGYSDAQAAGVVYAQDGAKPVVVVAGPIQKGSSKQVQSDARWHIGSITKSFTATLIMKLVDQGKLQLDAPIDTYLTRYSLQMHPQWRALTLRQILSHRAGIRTNASLGVLIRSKSYDPYDGRRRVMSELWVQPLSHPTGRYKYSNIGFVLAGIIAEEVANAPWETLVQREIAAPLSLKSLGFGAPRGAMDPRGHFGGELVSIPVNATNKNSDNPAWMGPAGTIHLTLGDLAKWGQAHVRACRGKFASFLSQASCQQMQTPQSANYGLGWMVKTSNGKNSVWHDGSNTMWYAKISIDVANDTVIAAATNSANNILVENLVDPETARKLVLQNGNFR